MALGINANKFKRKDIFMSSDRYLILLNHELLYVAAFQEKGSLYGFPENQIREISNDSILQACEQKAHAWLQASYLLNFAKKSF
jgi:hypothetical protein